MRKCYQKVSMVSIRRILFTLIIWLLAPLSSMASETSPVTALYNDLAKAQTITDSLKILTDIFDAGTSQERLDVIYDYFDAAVRAGDYTAQLDAIRNLSNIGSAMNDIEIVDRAMEMMKDIPDSEDKRQTMIFIYAGRANAEPFKIEEERDNYTRQVLKTIAEMPTDISPHEKVSRLFTLVILLSHQTQGDLLSQYLDDLDVSLNKLEQMPFNYLRSFYNFVATEAYWHNDESLKSIRVDRNQLLNLKRMENYTEGQGRTYRNYDLARYLCLERIARNYSDLSEAEFDDVIRQIEEITARDPKINELYMANKLLKVGRLVHDRKYSEALPLAKELADSAQDMYEKRYFTRQLIEIADSAGNVPAKLEAEIKNSHLLEEFVNYKTNERVRELQLLYDVNAQRRHQITEMLKVERRNNKFLLALAGIFVVLTFVMGVMYMYMRQKSNRFFKSNINLEKSLNELQKKDALLEKHLEEARRRETEKMQLMTYIAHELGTPLSAITNYSQMIIDALPDEEVKEYIKNFVSVINANTKVVQTVTNDMLEFALNESKPISVNRIAVNPNKQAVIAAETIEPTLNPGMSIEVKPAPGDPIITADPRRMQLLLLSCIDCLVRSLTAGHVIVSVAVSEKTCRFTIAAPGATSGKEPAKVPNYPATREALQASIAYNHEVPSMTITMEL